MTIEEAIKEAEEMICPVCGYLCDDRGGMWCIKKKSFVELLHGKREEKEAASA